MHLHRLHRLILLRKDRPDRTGDWSYPGSVEG
jgi:hypothetical protein